MEDNNNIFYSNEYLEQLRLVHSKIKWGGAVAGKIEEIVFMLKLSKESKILDYGSGFGCLKEELFKRHSYLDVEIIEYDPGIENKNITPSPCGFVVCIDVLEHIEPEYVDNVLDDLQRVILNIGYIAISLAPSDNNLPNGKNAHPSVHLVNWWSLKLKERFEIIRISHNETYCKYIVLRKIK
jgi:2-polyprenyl-3-methyl-5-hydroxy-6-metoxy-1,4-benzoquinol methylase